MRKVHIMLTFTVLEETASERRHYVSVYVIDKVCILQTADQEQSRRYPKNGRAGYRGYIVNYLFISLQHGVTNEILEYEPESCLMVA